MWRCCWVRGREGACDSRADDKRALHTEQYNPLFAEQVKEMEARASKLDLPKTMFYLNPNK